MSAVSCSVASQEKPNRPSQRTIQQFQVREGQCCPRIAAGRHRPYSPISPFPHSKLLYKGCDVWKIFRRLSASSPFHCHTQATYQYRHMLFVQPPLTITTQQDIALMQLNFEYSKLGAHIWRMDSAKRRSRTSPPSPSSLSLCSLTITLCTQGVRLTWAPKASCRLALGDIDIHREFTLYLVHLAYRGQRGIMLQSHPWL